MAARSAKLVRASSTASVSGAPPPTTTTVPQSSPRMKTGTAALVVNPSSWACSVHSLVTDIRSSRRAERRVRQTRCVTPSPLLGSRAPIRNSAGAPLRARISTDPSGS